MARSWSTLVNEGHKAVDRVAADKWKLGDLAMEVDPTGDGALLKEYAAEIGIEYKALEDYRFVAQVWPPHRRQQSASWSVHKELIDGDKPQVSELGAMVRKAKGNRVTVDSARKARGVQPTRHTPPPRDTQGKARLAMELLADPDVAQEVSRDDRTVSKLEQAASERRGKEQASRHDRGRKTSGLVRSHEVLQMVGDLIYAQGRIQKAGRTGRDAILGTQDARLISDEITQCETGLAYLRSIVNGDSLSDEVEAFLADQGAS